jgi:hypothetical protein
MEMISSHWFLFIGSFQISVIMRKVMISKIRVWHSLLWYTQKPNGLVSCLFWFAFVLDNEKILWCRTIWAFAQILYKRMCPQEYKIMPWVNQHHFGTMIKKSQNPFKSFLNSSDDVSSELVYVGWIFWRSSLQQFQIIISHKSSQNRFLLFVLYPFNVFLCLYFVVFLTPFQCFFFWV